MNKILGLYATLCEGRNIKAIRTITSPDIGISFEIAFACVKEKALSPSFRSAFCGVLFNAFVDVFPHSTYSTLMRRVWYIPNKHNDKNSTLNKVQFELFLKDFLDCAKCEVHFKARLRGCTVCLCFSGIMFYISKSGQSQLQEFLTEFVFDDDNLQKFTARNQVKQLYSDHNFSRVQIIFCLR